MGALETIAATLAAYSWLGPLVARIVVGLLFALSGRGKLFTERGRTRMVDTLRGAGIPAPEANALFVSGVELTFGCLLVVGALVPLSCVMLAGVMVVALATTVLPAIEADSLIDWLGEALYLPEVMILAILLWLLLAGPGPLSVDGLLLMPGSG